MEWITQRSDQIKLHERIVAHARRNQIPLFKPVYYKKPRYTKLRLDERTQVTLSQLRNRANYFYEKKS